MPTSVIHYLFLLLIFCSINAQLVFPEQSGVIDKNKANANGRMPLYAPNDCGVNELLYPGDQENDWICDCAPATVFYPDTEKCHPVFRKGPCPENEVLVLPPKKVVPECVANACKDGEVPINNICYRLGSRGPCVETPFNNVLDINPKTLLVECIQISLKMRFGSDYDLGNVELCAVGSKRHKENRCPQSQWTQTMSLSQNHT